MPNAKILIVDDEQDFCIWHKTSFINIFSLF